MYVCIRIVYKTGGPITSVSSIVKRFTGLILTVLLSIPTKDDNTWLFYDHVPRVSSLIAR